MTKVTRAVIVGGGIGGAATALSSPIRKRLNSYLSFFDNNMYLCVQST